MSWLLLPYERPRERHGVVAAGAIAAEFSAVHVLLGMTAIAIGWQAGVGNVLADVTVVAASLCVFSRQRKLCLAVVIEGNPLPVGGGMARLAARREAAGMGVVANMAVLAGNAGILEGG